MQPSSNDQADAPDASLRADARRNRAKVLDGAARAFAANGFDASYHEIARFAGVGVGVGTVYRRYPRREALIEAVLLDVLDALTAAAQAASAADDGWAAFARFFTDLSGRVLRHAGLSARLEGRGGPDVMDARRRLQDAGDALLQSAARAGLRPDMGWRDILFLAQAAASEGCGLDVQPDEHVRARALAVVLDGLRAR